MLKKKTGKIEIENPLETRKKNKITDLAGMAQIVGCHSIPQKVAG